MMPLQQSIGNDAAPIDDTTTSSSESEPTNCPQEDPNPETGQIRTPDRVAIEEMGFDHEESPNQHREPDRRYLSMPIAAVEVFLAPVIFVSAMMADNDDKWKPVFVGLFSGWILLLAIGLYIDLNPLQRPQFIKRSLWHLGSCILMLYIIATTTQPTADTLPQWIPLIVDCGLGVSIGIQNIPSNAREQLWKQLNELVGSFCGGVQVRFRGGYSEPGRLRAPGEVR